MKHNYGTTTNYSKYNPCSKLQLQVGFLCKTYHSINTAILCVQNPESLSDHVSMKANTQQEAIRLPYLEKFVDVDGTGAIEVHDFQSTVNVGQLAIGMQRLVHKCTTIAKLLQGNDLQIKSAVHKGGDRLQLTPSPLVSKK